MAALFNHLNHRPWTKVHQNGFHSSLCWFVVLRKRFPMPITALPQHTVRAIGSTSVITDPCSIVKELLDNALDASASTVFVEISQNTVDVIQVKDNGHGISSEDHAVVCKRTFTSKIQTINDLRNIGGTSLGFRGEALASAAEMSGSLNVITRVASEMVGSSIKYGRNGEMIRYLVLDIEVYARLTSSVALSVHRIRLALLSGLRTFLSISQFADRRRRRAPENCCQRPRNCYKHMPCVIQPRDCL